MVQLQTPICRRRMLALAAGGLVASASRAAATEPASAWAASSRSSIRLLMGEAARGRIIAGLEITLAPGYKTYWRSPGDSGIPPRFDWSGSENLASAEVLWPVPKRFSDGAGHSIGYVTDTILPVVVTAADPSRPVRLRLHLDYAVCEKICIPAQGQVALSLPAQGTTPHLTRIAQFKAQVPQSYPVGAQPQGPMLGHATWSAAEAASGQLALKLDCGAEGPMQVFVEGPDMWAFGMPTETMTAEGRRQVVIPVEDRPRMASGRQRFTITLATRDRAGEWAVDLDIPQARP